MPIMKNNETGESVEISMEEFLEAMSGKDITIKQEVRHADGTVTSSTIYGNNAGDGIDHSLNIFAEYGAVLNPALMKAKKAKEADETAEKIFVMDNSDIGYEATFDHLELPMMEIISCTEEKICVKRYIRDERKSVGEPIKEEEFFFADGTLSATLEEVQENELLLLAFSIFEIRKILKESGILQQLQELENKGSGVLISKDGDFIDAKIVQGEERPDLPCMMFGGLFAEDLDDAIMMRPYPDEMLDLWDDDDDEYEDEDDYDRFEELKKNVEAGEEGALGLLAKEYMQAGSEAFGDEENEYFRLSIETAQKAVEAGDLYGYWLLALAYDHGRGVDSDMEEAVKYYRAGAEAGEHNCQNSLACLYMRGDYLEENREEAFRLFEKSALQGNKLAEFSMAKCYENGHGTEVDLEKAIEWGEKAAVDADADVQYEVAKLYMYQGDDEKMLSAERARYWLKEAAMQGHDMAYGMLNFGPIWESEGIDLDDDFWNGDDDEDDDDIDSLIDDESFEEYAKPVLIDALMEYYDEQEIDYNLEELQAMSLEELKQILDEIL